jgi:transketolase
MRGQFVKTVEDIMAQDESLVTLLGDIGVFGFRNAFKLYPDRIYNVGICEQAMISMGAGLAKEGFIPLYHSIAPFVVERCYEQLKIDLIYQNLQANIVSVGSSYDYAGLGYTHHCPGDVLVLNALPGIEIVVPGTAAEFDCLFRESYNDGNLTYFRLSEQSNYQDRRVEFGQAAIIRLGAKATIIAVGPTLDRVIEASSEFDVTILYYTTIAPFDAKTLKENCDSGKIMVVEPYYSGAMTTEIHRCLKYAPLIIEMIGVPHRLITNYGHAPQHDQAFGLTVQNIREQLKGLVNA